MMGGTVWVPRGSTLPHTQLHFKGVKNLKIQESPLRNLWMEAWRI